MSTPIETRRLGPFKRVHPPVFVFSAVVMIGFVLYAGIFTGQAEHEFAALQDGIVHYFDWFYTLSVTVFLGFVIWLMLSRYGSIRLGDPDERPSYSYTSWFAMLFSAGMGIGLLFWSVAEPISQYMKPPYGEPQTLPAAELAMQLTFFHWGLHAWAIYIVVALSLAYFAYRHKLPLAIRSAFYPLLGERIYGWWGDLIDILAVFGTMFGIATSLGLGVIQVNTGLHYLLGVEQSPLNQVLLIAGITAIATFSVFTGLDKGIKRLSQLNLWLGLVLLLLVLGLGPTLFILEFFVESTGRYLQNLVQMSLWTDAVRSSDWLGKWTIFYWGWWIAWSPFVGMFIARISRGRTIREFIIGVLFAPTLATFAWLAIFGGTALHIQLFGGGGIAAAVAQNVSTALYVTLDDLPVRALTASIATVVIVTYFVTSSDSGSLVIDMLTAGGDPDPPRAQRVFWATTEGVIAAVLLLSGGLTALQTASIASGLPFTVVMLLMCWGLARALRRDAAQEGIGDVAPHRAEEDRG